MHALTWGQEGGPLALLLHGFPDSASTWRHLGPVLAERGWWVVAPHHRGYAPSSLAPDGNYQLGALVRDVLELHAALGGDGRAVVVGHDWGAMVAGGAAAHAPDRFAAAVLLSVPPLSGLLRRAWPPRVRDAPLWLRQAPRSWYIAFAQVPVVSTALGGPLVDLLWRRWAPGFDHAQDRAAAHRALPDRAHLAAALAYYRALANPLHRDRRYRAEQRSAFRPPRVRTLYLHGGADACVGAHLVRTAAAVLPEGSETLVVEGAGHFPHLEQPGLVNSVIGSFLAAQVGRGPVSCGTAPR